MSTGISHFSICSLPPVRTRLHNVLPHARPTTSLCTHRAGFEHTACAAPAARGMQTETPPKQAALARQVRQRMNRLGKPEHRARFCFFSKKKSLAGMRRFPIQSKSKFRWALTAALSILATPKTLFQPPSFAGACTTTSAKTTAT